LARGLVELDEAGVQHLGGGGALRLGDLGGVVPTPVADLVPQRTGRVLLPPVEAAFHVPVVEGVEVDDRGAPGLQRFVAHPGALDPGIVGRKRPGSSEDQARHQAHREQRGGADEAEPAGLGAFAGHAHLFSYRMPGAFWAPRTDVSLPGGSAQCASVFSGTGSVSIPVRRWVPSYPAVHGNGSNRFSTSPKCAVPSPGMTVLAAVTTAG